MNTNNNKSFMEKIKGILGLIYDKISTYIGSHKMETGFFLTFIFYFIKYIKQGFLYIFVYFWWILIINILFFSRKKEKFGK